MEILGLDIFYNKPLVSFSLDDSNRIILSRQVKFCGDKAPSFYAAIRPTSGLEDLC